MSANLRSHRRKRVKSMPPIETSIEAWPSFNSGNIHRRERAHSKSPVPRKFNNLASDLITRYVFNMKIDRLKFISPYSNISKPIPPAHRMAPNMIPKHSYQPNLEINTVSMKHQGDTMNRFMASHPCRKDEVDGFQVKEIMRLNPLNFFFTGKFM